MTDKNEIYLTIEIKKDDVGNQIYFLEDDFNQEPDYENLSADKEPSIGHFKELSDSNTELFINDKSNQFSKYFIPEKEGIYEIKLSLKKLLESCEYMFYKCKNLIKANLSNLDTSNVKSMEKMFLDCSNLKEVDLSNLNNINLTSMSYMFSGCTNLETINFSNFTTYKVKTMDHTFQFCKNLKKIDIEFNIESVQNMNQMFLECNNIESISLPWNQGESIYTMDEMFYNCKKLKNITMPRYNKDNVENLQLFKGCESLEKISINSGIEKIMKQNPKLKKKFCYKKTFCHIF